MPVRSNPEYLLGFYQPKIFIRNAHFNSIDFPSAGASRLRQRQFCIPKWRRRWSGASNSFKFSPPPLPSICCTITEQFGTFPRVRGIRCKRQQVFQTKQFLRAVNIKPRRNTIITPSSSSTSAAWTSVSQWEFPPSSSGVFSFFDPRRSLWGFG